MGGPMVKTWREECVIARERQARGEVPFRRAVVLRATRSWCTCGVGEQRRLHPGAVKYRRYSSGPLGLRLHLGPVDHALSDLGSAHVMGGFAFSVLNQDVAAAERALDAIEDRVVELKRGQ